MLQFDLDIFLILKCLYNNQSRMPVGGKVYDSEVIELDVSAQ